jgi:murein DD-endopeptidase MepM/ murein hydrolase activator NlpD
VPEAQARRLVRPPVAAARSARPAAPQPSERVEQLAAAIQSEPAAPDAVTAEQPSSEPAPVETATAMPLPNATIARTIDRIGYSCGKVASTSAIEGAHGAFTVTCTSGQSYRAAPVGGRYRFHRLGSQ